MDFETLRRALRLQADACRTMDAPFSATVMDIVAADLGDGGPFDGLLADWRERSFDALNTDALPIRLLAGFHDLVLAGETPALAAHYPGHGGAREPDRPQLAVALRDAAAAHGARFARFMASPPQTNEVGRSFCLFGGFLTVAAATGLPLRCLELGASAGLNLIWDRFRYDLGEGRGWGDPASPVRLAGSWSGEPPPLDTATTVVERQACDQAPVDLADPSAVRRLIAYVWAEQTERLARIRLAVDLAKAEGVRVEKADAGEWAERRLRPAPGTATVVYHSIFWQYPPKATQERMAAAIAAAGAAATPEAPFAWLRMEAEWGTDGADYRIVARLTAWPGGEERRLAEAHPHGAWVRWG